MGNTESKGTALITGASSGIGTATLSFTVDLPSGAECKYNGTGTATYNKGETVHGGNVITISEQVLTVTPAACGTTAKLDGVFSLELENGKSVWLM